MADWNEENGTEYSVRSYAKDRLKSTSNNSGKTTDFDCDIIYQVGGFVLSVSPDQLRELSIRVRKPQAEEKAAG